MNGAGEGNRTLVSFAYSLHGLMFFSASLISVTAISKMNGWQFVKKGQFQPLHRGFNASQRLATHQNFVRHENQPECLGLFASWCSLMKQA
jgi:hypothetical protein